MKRPIRLTTTLISSFMVAAFAYAIPAVAVESGQALEIAPPVLTLSADPGETIRTTINIRDVSTSSLVVTSTVNDFTAAGEDGSPKINTENTEPSPYSIISWVEPLPTLNLKPKAVEKLPLVINVPADAAPGGYYGVVRFSAAPPDAQGTGVSLSASLGTLVFIRVNGEAKEGMELVEFSIAKNGRTGTFFQSAPLEFIERIKNTGTVHEQPVSQVLVKDMFGNSVVNLNMNLEGRNVLPESTRKFTVNLDESAIGKRILFGRYTAELTAKYGTNDQVITEKIAFWVIPWGLILGLLIGLAAVVIFIIVALRRYKASVVRKTRTTRRR